MMVISMRPALKSELKKLREIAKTHGRGSQEYQAQLKKSAERMKRNMSALMKDEK